MTQEIKKMKIVKLIGGEYIAQEDIKIGDIVVFSKSTPDTTKEKIESFLMYANPDDRDMLRGALKALLSSQREAFWEKVKDELLDIVVTTDWEHESSVGVDRLSKLAETYFKDD